ncbi:MAG: TrkH family potassium uptake protein [Pseudomonadales bacterium]
MLKPILLIVGVALIGLAVFITIPAAFAWWYAEPTSNAFLTSAALVLASGLLLAYPNRAARVTVLPKQTFVITSVVWLATSAFGALPFVIYSDIDYADAVFETMSGITTTGSTVLVGLETLPHSVLLWRSLLQWLGGLGFMVMAIGILPFLGVGGMRLFRSESSDWSEKATPRTRSFAGYLALVYLALSIACALAYWVGGMTPFDAVNHAMTTVSTGGYSTWDASFGHFNSRLLQWTAVVFMILGALPFVLYVRAVRRQATGFLQDDQVRAFALLLIVASGATAIWLIADHLFTPFTALTVATFNVVSVVTTTGYASADYTLWGSFPVMMFFYLTFVGGCSGSTTGGMKIFRLQLALQVLRNQYLRLVHTRGVFRVEFNGRTVGEDVVRSLIGFSFAYFMTIGLLALGLSLFDLDLVTAFSASATAVGNVGPGLGSVVGPAGNFAAIPDGAKWLLSLGMLAGRLEILTITVLFTRRFWYS